MEVTQYRDFLLQQRQTFDEDMPVRFFEVLNFFNRSGEKFSFLFSRMHILGSDQTLWIFYSWLAKIHVTKINIAKRNRKHVFASPLIILAVEISFCFLRFLN